MERVLILVELGSSSLYRRSSSLVLFAALSVVLAASAAFGGVQDFGRFTVDVLRGWTAEPDGSTVGITKNDNTASLSITVDSMDGASLKEIADAFVVELNGKNLTQGDGTYTFEATNPNGVAMRCVLSGDGTDYVLIVATGYDNAPDEVSAMMDSLQEK